MNEVLLHKRVVKFLNTLNEDRKSKVLDAIRLLQKFPMVRFDVKKIGPKTFRLRKGEIRIIFDFDSETDKVYVKFAEFRGRAYK